MAGEWREATVGEIAAPVRNALVGGPFGSNLVSADVKRILRKYGYPPDKQEKATLTVLEQAEVLSESWAVT